jgi:hypothetical protein
MHMSLRRIQGSAALEKMAYTEHGRSVANNNAIAHI